MQIAKNSGKVSHKNKRGSKPHSIAVRVKGPFDLRLSLAGAASFLPVQAPSELTTVIDRKGREVVVNVSQPLHRLWTIHASATPPIDEISLRQITKWIVCSELDLKPFYALVKREQTLDAIVLSLNGLKPLRSKNLFEMAITAITEQQLSLASAFHIRERLVSRFGTRVDNLWRFPLARTLARASLEDLTECGLSHRKAGYVRGIAERVADGSLEFDALKHESDQAIREKLIRIPGFGKWSADYILARGYGRVDALPSDDVGLQRAVSHYFAHDKRLTAAKLERRLAPFRPFRALAAYYLAVHWRLRLLRHGQTRPQIPR